MSHSALIALFLATPTVAHSDASPSQELRRLEDTILLGLPPVRHDGFLAARSAWRIFKDAECRQRHTNYPEITTFEECDRIMHMEGLKDLRQQLRWLHGLPGNVR
ncbi:hypothetical protein [Ochrobactrum teleogrylli]